MPRLGNRSVCSDPLTLDRWNPIQPDASQILTSYQVAPTILKGRELCHTAPRLHGPGYLGSVLGQRQSGRPVMTPSQKIEPHSEIDWCVARVAVQEDEELLRDIVQTMLQELPRLCAEAEFSFATADARRLEIAAHTLKSNLRYFGCRSAVQLAGQLESLSMRGALAEAARVWPTLCDHIGQLALALQRYLQTPIIDHA